MKVSIITATYNSAETISDTLKSLNEQTYQNIEHVIVIDGPQFAEEMVDAGNVFQQVILGQEYAVPDVMGLQARQAEGRAGHMIAGGVVTRHQL